MINNNIFERKNKYLNEKEKYKIESVLEFSDFSYLDKIKNKKEFNEVIKYLAKTLGRSTRTIQREIKRGSTEVIDYFHNKHIIYSANKSISRYNKVKLNKSNNARINIEPKLAHFLVSELNKRKSPYVARLNAIKAKFEVNFNLKTLYNYIRKGLFKKYGLDLTKLPYKKKKKNYNRENRVKKVGGLSINDRPQIINDRNEFGHFEIDCVVGSSKGKSTAILVLTERVSRLNIVRKIELKRNEYVINELIDILNSPLYPIKSITSDNGSEFANCSIITKIGIPWYYANPYSSFERGSNENNNRFIRRFIPKGTSIDKYTKDDIKEIENFMNNYPRAIHNGKSAKEIYLENLRQLKKS